MTKTLGKRNKAPVETEVKFYLMDSVKLSKSLFTSGASMIKPRILERNWRYDDAVGNLKKTEQVLRLRQDQQVTLTYKAAMKKGSEVAERQELEVEVSDLVLARRILESLGFHPILVYEKYRTTYQMRDCEIVLDELPFGVFCEIEGGSPQTIHSLAGALGLDWHHRIVDSYSALFDRLKASKGLKFRDLTFKNFKGFNISAADLGVSPADLT